MSTAPLWPIAADARETSRVGRYMTWLEETRALTFADHEELWRWSVTDLDGFWSSIWEYFVIAPGAVPKPTFTERLMPGTKWFPTAQVNYAEYLLRQWDDRSNEVAIVARSQTRSASEMTAGELRTQVTNVRAALLKLGVKKGDRVAAYLPNIPETIVAFLASASIGAIWSSVASEFGPRSVIDRFSQIEPKVLFVVAGYTYGDKPIDCRERVAEVVSTLTTVEHIVEIPYSDFSLATPGVTLWNELTVPTNEELTFEPVAFDHPLYVLYSSGTTGLPKAIIHGHGGILIEHLKHHALSWDLGEGDRMLWFTTTAWMMWNALVSDLLVGTSIVVVDGNPMFPSMEYQWQLAAETQSTVMGLSPAFVMNCRKAGIEPTKSFDLSNVRVLYAAGSPLPAEGATWLFERFGPDVRFNIGSGGTDVCCGLVQGSPLLDAWPGEMSGRVIGVSAFAYNDAGEVVVGELGELVITEPMPSMPVGFWNDPDGSRLKATYFEHFPGVMRFGDWIRFSEQGSSIITGRSDATLNRGGVRLGTAELYRVVEELPEVSDSLVVHLEDPDGGAGELVLFVVLPDGELTPDIRSLITSSLRSELSPRHVPDTVIRVGGVPRNLVGKKLELPVKKILQGADPAAVVSRDAMANPDSLNDYIAYERTRATS
jgi:acetoacetyl-CoA synthetase